MNCRIASCARVLPAVPALMLAGVLAACARTSRTPEPPALPAGTALTAPADLPPAYDETRLIEIEQPRSSSVRVGIAPETIRVDVPAGVVRYVAVARGIRPPPTKASAATAASGAFLPAGRQTAPGWRQTARGKTSAARISSPMCGVWPAKACAWARPSIPTRTPSSAPCKRADAARSTATERATPRRKALTPVKTWPQTGAFCSLFESKYKAPKTPPSHGLTGFVAIKAGAK